MQQSVIQSIEDELPAATSAHSIAYVRWVRGNWYLQISVDGDGKMSHSTNLPLDKLQGLKGLNWSSFDARYKEDLKRAIALLDEMNKTSGEVANDGNV